MECLEGESAFGGGVLLYQAFELTGYNTMLGDIPYLQLGFMRLSEGETLWGASMGH
jgi:hypothetical protein